MGWRWRNGLEQKLIGWRAGGWRELQADRKLQAETSWLLPEPCLRAPRFLLPLTPRFLRPELQALIVVLQNGSGFCLCSLIFDREDLDGFHADPRGQGDRLWRHSEDDTGEDCGLENVVPWAGSCVVEGGELETGSVPLDSALRAAGPPSYPNVVLVLRL